MSIIPAIAIIAIIGFIAQRTGLCLVNATRRAMGGDISLLLAK
jgi:hypothetical protein